MSSRFSVPNIKQGEYTATVYTWIKDGNYKDAIAFLSQQQVSQPNSRPILSLLGYCYYVTQDFLQAASCYEQLTQICPECDFYRINHAQCLYQSCLYEDAMRITFALQDIIQRREKSGEKPSSAALGGGPLRASRTQVLKLQAAIKYAEDEIQAARGLIDQLPQEDPDREINLACLLYKENRFEEAKTKFQQAVHQSPSHYQCDLSYNLAACFYKLKQYPTAMKHIGDIIERGIREHPELSVGAATEGIEVRSVGNTLTLQETFLVEAFNLKAAIEYQNRNYEAAAEALTDMPPRSEEELDAVTLHNQALMISFNENYTGSSSSTLGADPTEGFEKLQFLIQQNPFPPETFANLLLLYCKYEYYDLAADVMAENAHYTYKYLSPFLYEFLDALITQQTSPEDAYRKFDEMAAKHIDQLRKLQKQLADVQGTSTKAPTGGQGAGAGGGTGPQSAQYKKVKAEYDAALELYLPVLMGQAKICWDQENYEQVEKIFRKSVDFLQDHDVWKLNVAHVLFMQETKFKEATGFYEPLVKKNYDHILDVSAIVLANLCVCYIMTGQNEDAEELMRKIEKEEEQLAYSDAERKIFHLCIVNLVIGTLYCSKGNYEFGISRVMKSLEPYSKKLGTDTWFYTKRCFLALLEGLSKQIVTVRDGILDDAVQFLTHCEEYGKKIKAIVEPPLELETLHPGKNTIAYEARLLKRLILELID